MSVTNTEGTRQGFVRKAVAAYRLDTGRAPPPQIMEMLAVGAMAVLLENRSGMP